VEETPAAVAGDPAAVANEPATVEKKRPGKRPILIPAKKPPPKGVWDPKALLPPK
jgi:hypothetical protein